MAAKDGPGRERRLREYGLTAAELGASGGQTVMVALLPLLLSEHTSSTTLIGAVIAGEGVFAILVPYVVGRASDRLPEGPTRRFGRRNFFLLLAAPVMAAALVAAPFLGSFWLMSGAAFLFFAALHAFLTPLRALVVDSVPEERRGRVQGVLGAFHAGGLGFGLVAGGLLFSAWRPLPFLVAAALVVATTFATYGATPRSSHEHDPQEERSEKGFWKEMAARPRVRWFLAANALWSGAIDGIRPFIFLFATAVVGVSVSGASGLLAVLLVGVGLGSVLTGRLGDRYGKARVLLAGTLVTGAVMLGGLMVRDVLTAAVLLLPVGLAAAALISLPYPVYAELTEGQALGRATGVYNVSIGLARIAAPLMVGAAIEHARPLFPDHDGYPAMWGVAGLMALAAGLALWRTRTRAASRG